MSSELARKIAKAICVKQRLSEKHNLEGMAEVIDREVSPMLDEIPRLRDGHVQHMSHLYGNEIAQQHLRGKIGCKVCAALATLTPTEQP